MNVFKNVVIVMMIISSTVFLYGYSAKAIGKATVSEKVPTDPIAIPVAFLPDTAIAPHIQLVFALDATGSMGGLISTAKEKIWSIASSLSQAQPAPKIEIGLVFYRDKGDAFVTKIIPMSSQLDDVYEKLMEIEAQGGGDSPESVNQGFDDAVNKITWASDDRTIKNLFIVGDLFPHMDYTDDVKYPITCAKAQEKGIIVNTILMGNNSETARVWKEIAHCGKGEYIELNMNANNINIVTPYDADLKKVQEAIDASRLYYGGEKELYKNESKSLQSKTINAGSSVSSSATRADYKMSTKESKEEYYGEKELYNDVVKGRVSMDTIKTVFLPKILQNKTAAERSAYVKQQITYRDSLEKALSVASKNRQVYIASELAKRDSGELKKTFNNRVFESIQEQAKTKGVNIDGKVKY